MDLNLEVDFSGVNAATGGLAILDPGLHSGIIDEFTHYTDNGNVLYAYLNTDGLTHRERFSLDHPAGLSFLKAFLLSAGVPESKLSGKGKIPFGKLVGRKIYFNYTPPRVDENGKRVEGTYPKYLFYSEARYNKMLSYQNASPQVEAAASSTAVPANGASQGDFEFLLG